jgi:DNA-directed RNA polymerase subunit L
MSLKVESLIKDYKIYDISNTQVKWYRYLCVHPNAKNYHILIDMNEDPIRMYSQNLQLVLDKGLRTYDEAKLALADELERKAGFLRKNK